MPEVSIAKPRQTEVTIEDKKFILQHPGARASVQLRDRCKNRHGQIVEENLYQELMKHVIVEPKVSWDYFDEHPEVFDELMEKALLYITNDKSFR